MAWIDARTRSDGVASCRVRWRLGGARDGMLQTETFAAGSDAQNAARAEGFKRMVVAAGDFWPDGWVKGAGFVRQNPAAGASATAPRTVREVGLEYVDQIVDCSPGQRKRYRAPIGLLTTVEVRGKTGMYQPNSCVAEVAWSLPKDRACRLYRHRFRRSSSNRDATASTSLMKETVRLAVGL